MHENPINNCKNEREGELSVTTLWSVRASKALTG